MVDSLIFQILFFAWWLVGSALLAKILIIFCVVSFGGTQDF